MDAEYLLTATRSARRSLDLDAPVDLGDIRGCRRMAQSRQGAGARPRRRRPAHRTTAAQPRGSARCHAYSPSR
jgi:hypothetical protein